MIRRATRERKRLRRVHVSSPRLAAYTYIYTYRHIYVQICTYMYIYIYIYVFIYIYINIYIHIIRLSLYIPTFLCSLSFLCVYIYINTYINIYIYTRRNTHTYRRKTHTRTGTRRRFADTRHHTYVCTSKYTYMYPTNIHARIRRRIREISKVEQRALYGSFFIYF